MSEEKYLSFLMIYIIYLIYNIWPRRKQNSNQAKGFESSSEQSMSKQGNQEN